MRELTGCGAVPLAAAQFGDGDDSLDREHIGEVYSLCLHTGFRETAHEEHPKGTRPHAYSTLNPIFVSPALSCIPSILSHSPRGIISRFSFFPVILKCNTFLSPRRIAVGDDHCVSYSKFSWRKICPDVVLKGMRGSGMTIFGYVEVGQTRGQGAFGSFW